MKGKNLVPLQPHVNSLLSPSPSAPSNSLTAYEITKHLKNKIDAICRGNSIAQVYIPLNIPCTKSHLVISSFDLDTTEEVAKLFSYHLSNEPCFLTTTTVNLFFFPPRHPHSHPQSLPFY